MTQFQERAKKLVIYISELCEQRGTHNECIAITESALLETRNEAIEEALNAAETCSVSDAAFSPYQVRADICSKISKLKRDK